MSPNVLEKPDTEPVAKAPIPRVDLLAVATLKLESWRLREESDVVVEVEEVVVHMDVLSVAVAAPNKLLCLNSGASRLA